MWIKICGLTTSDAVATAVEARVAAIGFVFTSSVRQLTAAKAHALAAPARGRVRCIAVMRQPSRTLFDEVLAHFRPDGVQADAADLADLTIPRELEVLPVLRAESSLPEPLPARVLYEGPASGVGIAVDWTLAATLARSCELVLAGGLTSQNVAAAIRQVRPFGVDVSSGVEASPGVKSPREITRFVEAARAACVELAASS
jgi:phosphoribosylanthranilate isomerase